MLKSEGIYNAVMKGEYDGLLTECYGADRLEYNRKRYEEALGVWSRIYGRARKATVYSVPYSVLLAGDGADVSIPTDLDMIVVAADNYTNISRVRCRNYLGEDNVDLYQHGPYGDEGGFVIGVVRGVQQGFLHYGHRRMKSVDMYIDADTLPGQGLDDANHLAMAVAYIINDLCYMGEKLSEKELAQIVQYALANHVMMDNYATDTYASLRGKAVTGDFTNADAEIITEIEADMLDCSVYTVNIGTTDVNIDDDEVDPRLDAFLAKLGKDVEELSEKEFYTLLGEMADVDKEASLFLMDYYTQENFGRIYAANAVDGMGSPSVEATAEIEKESVGGAATIYRCKVNKPYWMVLCCVAEAAKEAFTATMEKLYGPGCVVPVNKAVAGARRVID
ncbi:MAG: hypothetical protein IJ410_06765 [Oscillospiraceae bacterium]|nr:hypothetical protein [Oscillospiraceae bacterium]